MKNIMEKTKEKMKNKEIFNKKCQLCKVGFDVWLSSSNLNPEREERIRGHFSRYCPDCEPSEAKETKILS